jgi:hypothetical protein
VEDFYIGDWFNFLDWKEEPEDSEAEFRVKVGFDKDLDFGLFEREVRWDAEQFCKMVDAKFSIWKDHFVPKSNNLEYFLSVEYLFWNQGFGSLEGFDEKVGRVLEWRILGLFDCKILIEESVEE